MNWYYVDGAGKEAGPLEDSALDALLASGGITYDTLVWREGLTDWQPLRQLRPTAPPMAAPPVAVTTSGEAVCAECGGLFPIDDTIRVGNARVCANCKPVFVQKMREGMSVEQAGLLRYAGFWLRFGAVFVDGIILYVINTAINLGSGLGFAGSQRNSEPGGAMFLVLIGVILLQLLIRMTYEVVMIGKYGATLGKMACKIHVVMPDGSKVTYLRAFGRYFAKLVSSLTCLIGFIMAGFDPEKRALHDRICNTRVVFK